MNRKIHNLTSCLSILYLKRLRSLETNLNLNKLKFTRLLKNENLLLNYTIKNKSIRLLPIWFDTQPIFGSLTHISTKCCKIYRQIKYLDDINFGLGLYLLSTPSGLCTNNNAKTHKEGGEILLKIT